MREKYLPVCLKQKFDYEPREVDEQNSFPSSDQQKYENFSSNDCACTRLIRISDFEKKWFQVFFAMTSTREIKGRDNWKENLVNSPT